MKPYLSGLAPLALLPATLLLFTSCSSAPKVEKSETAVYQEGVPGGTLVEAYKIPVMISDIVPASRRVTLIAPDGSRNTFTAEPDDSTFGRLKVGEKVEATVTRQLVVSLLMNGAPLSESQATAAVLAPGGTESGAMKSDTLQRTARIGAIDKKGRRVTLRFADGTSTAFDVRKDVELSRLKTGQEVLIRTSSAVVLTLGKP
jgi:Cu/Ag efflux protein CusF